MIFSLDYCKRMNIPLLACLIGLLSSCKSLEPRSDSKLVTDPKSEKLSQRALSLYSQYRPGEAIKLWLECAAQSNSGHDYKFAAKCLINAGGAQLAMFRYHDALGTMERARKMAEQSGDRDFTSSSNANIASLYLQMGNYAGAEEAGERALSGLRESNPMYARVMIPLAQIQAEQHGLATAEPLLRKAIEGAYRTNDPDTAAWAYEYLGFRYEQEHRLDEADFALTESLRIRKMFHLNDIGSSYYHLAMVRSDQGQNASASALFNSAIEEAQKPGNVTPAWKIHFERGRLFEKQGDRQGAWANLGKAVELARDWRSEVVANDANRTSSEAALSALYSHYVNTGNRYAIRHGGDLARDTLQAAEENRAASLRSLTERETGWHNNLPTEYWGILAKLQVAERALIGTDSPENRADAARWRSRLDEIEADSGAPKGFVGEPVVKALQRKLDDSSVFLSFQLGETESWIWVVSRQEILVQALPPQAGLVTKIKKFQVATQGGLPDATVLGAGLYQDLFGNLPGRFAGMERWIISLDQQLFSLPFPALVTRFEQGKPVYLGTERALEITPGAIMFAASGKQSDFGRFLLGVGDAIYNQADPRWQPTRSGSARLTNAMERDNPPGLNLFHFARLWGAAEEIRAVANAWEPSGHILLKGNDISRERLWKEFSKQPSVIHFATHILEANDQLHTGWISLSMGPGGRPEFLSPAEISAHKSRTALVVLNGCSSGAGEIRAASGLMGLTRAWMGAGADNVLATRWPGPDDGGIFFVHFYENLKASPEKGAAYALRQASRQGVEAGGWRANPQFWASYFLTSVN